MSRWSQLQRSCTQVTRVVTQEHDVSVTSVVSEAVFMSSFSVVVLAAGYGTRLLADVELRPDLPQWRYLTQVRGSLN